MAQGWELALPVKLLGIASTECLAAEAQSQDWLGRVNFIIDAQRNELYFAQYEIDAKKCRAISPLKLVTVEEVRAKTAAGEIIAGPEAGRWFEQARILFPGAATLAKLAESRTDFLPGDKLEPIYLRETNFVKAPPPRELS